MKGLGKKLPVLFLAALVITFFLGAFLNINVPILTPLVAFLVNLLSGAGTPSLGGGGVPTAGNPGTAVINTARSAQQVADQLGSFTAGKIILAVMILVLIALARPLIHWLLGVFTKEAEKAKGAFHGKRDTWFTVIEVAFPVIAIWLTKNTEAVISVVVVVMLVDIVGLTLSRLLNRAVKKFIGGGGIATDFLSEVPEYTYQAIRIGLVLAWGLALLPSLSNLIGGIRVLGFGLGQLIIQFSNDLSPVAGGNKFIIACATGLALLKVIREFQDIIWD